MSALGWWPRDGRGRAIATFCVLIGALYLAKSVYRGLSYTRGDFYYTMPGEYARRWNPTLWNSPDLQEARGYNRGEYYYGPTQYLTLLPLVFINSYEQIASVLLVLYAVVLIAACYVLWDLLARGEGQVGQVGQVGLMAPAIFALALAFLPLTQAFVQREFEVVALLALICACALVARGREIGGGAAVAYLTWFKYWPIVLLGTFVLHRRVKGLVAFAGASAVLLLAAQFLFGLDHFLIGRTATIVGGLVRPLGAGDVLYPVIERGALKSDFCRQWVQGRGTAADVRWALCGVEDRWPWLSAKAAFAGLVLVTGAAFTWGAVMLERRRSDADLMKWGAIWEFSILTIAGVVFLHAHYYYLIMFVLPLGALLFWYATRPQPWRATKLAIWAIAYLLLNALMIPTTWLSTLLQRDAWQAYLESGLCLLGTLMLLALVIWEFAQLTRRAPSALAAV
ncbi:MAG: DUF2029 domain-containing protein [Acidobacteria bacterium]|nr:DUF2029 domain-containing protein [Acidobacteriota bacterium]